MLHVAIRVQPSEYGSGTFAAEPIPAGALIWNQPVGDPTVLLLTRAQARAADSAGVPVLRWAPADPDGTYRLAVDGSQFMNHKDPADPGANTITCPACGAVTASRDIGPGEQIYCDYTADDADVAIKVAGLVPPKSRPRHPACADPDCR